MKKTVRSIITTLLIASLLCTAAFASQTKTYPQKVLVEPGKKTTADFEISIYNYVGDITVTLPVGRGEYSGMEKVENETHTLAVVLAPNPNNDEKIISYFAIRNFHYESCCHNAS